MKNALSIVMLSSLFVACAGARDPSSVEPLLFLPQQREIALPLVPTEQPQALFLTARCTDRARGSARCAHVSVRLDTVLATPTPSIGDRNRLLALLLGISDYNCAAFTAHAFGRKAQLHTATSVLSSVATAVNARSTRNSSTADLLRLASNTANDVLGSDLQVGSAEASVEVAIGNARKKMRDRIWTRAGEDVERYPLLAALGDLAEYDDVCSLQRGKELALEAAAEATREQQARALEALLRLQQTAPAPLPAATQQAINSQ